jgi:type II secretory pathway component GspD/PulD (secretin)
MNRLVCFVVLLILVVAGPLCAAEPTPPARFTPPPKLGQGLVPSGTPAATLTPTPTPAPTPVPDAVATPVSTPLGTVTFPATGQSSAPQPIGATAAARYTETTPPSGQTAQLLSPDHRVTPSDVEFLRLQLARCTTGSITLNVENMEITTLLKMLSIVRHANILASPEVKGTVNVNLFQVPFEDALQSIVGIAGYTHYTRDGIIYVTTEANKSKLPMGSHDLAIRTFRVEYASPDELLATVKEFVSPGGKAVLNPSDHAIVVKDSPAYLDAIENLIRQSDTPPRFEKLTLRRFRIDHAVPEEMLAAVQKFISKSGKVMLSPQDRSIVVQDGPEVIAAIEDLIRQQDVPPRQVLISAQILRVDLTNDLNLGAELSRNWWAPSTLNLSKTGTLNGIPYTLDNLNNAGNGVLLGDLSTGANGFFWGAIWKNKQVLLKAMASKGKVETLASPEVLAVDSKEAQMIIGGKLGYKTNAQADNNTTFENVQFLDVGTQINVTPSIGRDGLITMKIYPKVSSGQIVQGIPVEDTTEVSTTMLVRDGETIAIGGLIDKHKERTRTQVPFLGDIPYLGLLFGYNSWVNHRTEIVILITPHIVGPERDTAMDATIGTYTGNTSLLSDPPLLPSAFDGMPGKAASPEGTATEMPAKR